MLSQRTLISPLVGALLLLSCVHCLAGEAINCGLVVVPDNSTTVIEGCSDLRLRAIGTHHVALTIRRCNISYWAFDELGSTFGLLNVTIVLEGCLVRNGLQIVLLADVEIDRLLLFVENSSVDIDDSTSLCVVAEGRHPSSCTNRHLFLLFSSVIASRICNISVVLRNSNVSIQSAEHGAVLDDAHITIETRAVSVFSFRIVGSSHSIFGGIMLSLQSSEVRLESCIRAGVNCSDSVYVVRIRSDGDVRVDTIHVFVTDCRIFARSPNDVILLSQSMYESTALGVRVALLNATVVTSTVGTAVLDNSVTGRLHALIACYGGSWTNTSLSVVSSSVLIDVIAGDAELQHWATGVAGAGGTAVYGERVEFDFSCTVVIVNVSISVNATRGTFSSLYGSYLGSIVSFYRLNHLKANVSVRNSDVVLIVPQICPRMRSANLSLPTGVAVLTSNGGMFDVAVAVLCFSQSETPRLNFIRTVVMNASARMSLDEVPGSNPGTCGSISPLTSSILSMKFVASFQVHYFVAVIGGVSRDPSRLASQCTGIPFPLTGGVTAPPVAIATIDANVLNYRLTISGTLDESSVAIALLVFSGFYVNNSLVEVGRFGEALSQPAIRTGVVVDHGLLSASNSTLSEVTINVVDTVINDGCNTSSSTILLADNATCERCTVNFVRSALPPMGRIVRVEPGSAWDEGSLIRAQCSWYRGAPALPSFDGYGVGPFELVAPPLSGCAEAPSDNVRLCLPPIVPTLPGKRNDVVVASVVMSLVAGTSLRTPMTTAAVLGAHLSSADDCSAVTFQDASEGNYFAWTLGSGESQYMRATVAGAMLLGCALVVVGLVLTSALAKVRSIKWRDACSRFRMPSVVVPLVVQWLVMPGIAGSVALVASTTTPGDITLGVVGLIWGLLCTAWVATTVQWAETAAQAVWRRGLVSAGRAPAVTVVHLLTSRTCDWVDTVKGTHFVSMHGCVFEGFVERRCWYAVVEVATTAVYGTLQGVAAVVATRSLSCSPVKICFAVAELISFAFLAVIRPHASLVDFATSLLLLGLGALHGLLLLLQSVCDLCADLSELAALTQLYCSLVAPAFVLTTVVVGLIMGVVHHDAFAFKGVPYMVVASLLLLFRDSRAPPSSSVERRLKAVRRTESSDSIERLAKLVELICARQCARYYNHERVRTVRTGRPRTSHPAGLAN